MSNQQSKDINKFASLFGLKMGQVSVEKMFPNYFKDVDLKKLTNKTTRIVYLLESNKSEIDELQYLIQQILAVHGGWKDNVGVINNIIRSLGLFINSEYAVEKILQKSIEDVISEKNQPVSQNELLVGDVVGSDSPKISIPIIQERYRSLDSLKIFLCHSSGDKAAIRDLYQRLRAEYFNPWLDEEDLLAGQDWQTEIPKKVKESDIVIVCLSRSSISKEGYVQKEIKYALDAADEKPEGVIFIIPLKLEECHVPERLGRWQWLNFYEDKGFEKLMRSLQERKIQLKKK